jgi:hypothetical protein
LIAAPKIQKGIPPCPPEAHTAILFWRQAKRITVQKPVNAEHSKKDAEGPE